MCFLEVLWLLLEEAERFFPAVHDGLSPFGVPAR